MANEKHFIRIDINGDPEKLPKENGKYLAGVNAPDSIPYICKFITDDPEYKRDWIEEIDWYLQPVPSNADEIIMKQDELIDRLKGILETVFHYKIQKGSHTDKLESELKELRK